MTTCGQCSQLIDTSSSPPSYRTFCSIECSDRWDVDHPEDAARWIGIQDLDMRQRAELDALLGHGAAC